MAVDGTNKLQIIVEGKDGTTKVLKGIESSIIRFVGAVSAALATISVAVFPVKAAASFQKELLNVGKTTDFTDRQLSQLSDGLKTLSYHLNVSAEDLATIAAAGGQQGLGKEGVEGILAFTEAASRLSSVLDITAEEAGSAIGRLTNIFRISVKEAERISSLLNEVSNNSTASGAELIDIVQRIGTAGGTLGIKQAAALAATGRDLGLTVETVGTSFNKIFLQLQTEAANIAPVLGVPVEQFAKTVREDGVGALKQYLVALSKMDNLQRAAFAEKTTGGGRIFALISALVNDANSGFQVLDRNIASSVLGFDQGTSAIKEQERVLSGLIAQGQVLKNVFVGIAETIGRQALPYLTKLTKELQVWAQDPAVIEAFSRLAQYIGEVVKGGIELVKVLSSLSVVMGPLLTIFKLFLEVKLAGAMIGITLALGKQLLTIGRTAKAWYSLLTANRAAVRGMAAQANAASASALAGGRPAPTLTVAGSVAQRLGKTLEEQEALVRRQATSAQLLNSLTIRRAKILGDVKAEMQAITLSAKAQATAAYDSVIASGGTKKAASAARRGVAASLNRRLLDLKAFESNANVAYNDALARRSASLQNITRDATRATKSVESLKGLGLTFTTLRTSVLGAATAIGTFLGRVLAIAGSVAGVVSLILLILDLTGVLQPALEGLKAFFGIANVAEAETKRQREERLKSQEEESRKNEELLKLYEQQLKAKKDLGNVATAKDTQTAGLFNNSFSAQANQLAIVNGAYEALQQRGAKIAGTIEFIGVKWDDVNTKLKEAQATYDRLSKQKATQDLVAGSDDKRVLQFKVSEKDVKEAKARVDALATSLDLLGTARSRFEQNAVENGQKIAAAAADAVVQAEKLAPFYDKAGVAALHAFDQMLQAKQKLETATKALVELEKQGNSAGASEEDKVAFITAAEDVKQLEASLDLLANTYESVRTSSANATIFMANAFPDAAKASIGSVQSLLKVLGGVGTEFNLKLEETKTGLDKQAKDIEDKLAEIERKRASRVARAAVGDITQLFSGKSRQSEKVAQEAKAQAVRDSAPLKEELAGITARQNALKLEAIEADALAAAHKRIAVAVREAQDSGKAGIANFAGTAALKAVTDQQILAQKRVEEGARFNAENIKQLYEGAKTNLHAVVAEAKKEVGSLSQYYSSRNLTIKLANFDINQNRGNEEYKKFQDETIASERERLAASGLSSAEIEKQIGYLQESLAWANKIRDSVQDEARQRVVISGIQEQLTTEQNALNDASARASLLAEQAAKAQAAGNTTLAADFAHEAQIEARKAEIATSALNDRVKEFKAEAAKPVSGPFGASFVVSNEEIAKVVQESATAQVDAAASIKVATEQAANASTKWANDQLASLNALTVKSEDYQKTLDAISKTIPALASLQNNLAAIVIEGTKGVPEVLADLKLIANTNFQSLDAFATIGNQNEKVAELESHIKGIAEAYANATVGAGKSFEEGAKDAVASVAAIESTANESLARLRKDLDANAVGIKLAFPTAEEVLQRQLDNKTFLATVDFRSTGQGADKKAQGGHVRGPGTGTSDSILTWLSNGEYVSDAQTTAFFGPQFFAGMKSLARGGRSALTNFATKLSGGISLPALAGGGYIGAPTLAANGVQSLLASEGKGGIIGRVAVDLTADGQKVSLLGERGEVDKLVKALNRMKRG